MNYWFDSSDIVIRDIDPIWYHRDPIYTFEFSDERFFISMGFNPEVFIRNLRERKHRDYGSKYSRIYSYCTLHFSSYCLFTYNLCKNGKSKWLNFTETRLLIYYQCNYWIKKWKKNFYFGSFFFLNDQTTTSRILLNPSIVERNQIDFFLLYSLLQYKFLLQKKEV